VTGGNVGLWPNLCVFVLSMIVCIGGVLKAISGESYGWRVVGIAVVAHFFNCVGFVFYYLQ
jgi:hypothetical protein